jgi:hypothetical protein
MKAKNRYREKGSGGELMGCYLLRTACLALSLMFLHGVTSGQDLEPRAYSRSPVGTNFVLFSVGHQSGDVLLDSALPLEDVSVKLNSFVGGYGRTFGLVRRQANISFVVPYIVGHAKGTVFETQQEVRRSGVGDVRARFTMILHGSPALTPKEFAMRKPTTLIGASLSVVVPNGQYDPNRLINIGSNRWAFKPEIGLSYPYKRWTMEVAGGVWLFKDNNDFFGHVRRQQKPLASFQGHLIYTIRPRMWLAVNATYFSGGRTTVNGVVNSDLQKNSRFGSTFSLPLNQRNSLKVSFAKGLTTRIGGDLTSISLSWSYTWFD